MALTSPADPVAADGVSTEDWPPRIHPQLQLHPHELLSLGLFLPNPPAAANAAPPAAAAHLQFDRRCAWYVVD